VPEPHAADPPHPDEVESPPPRPVGRSVAVSYGPHQAVSRARRATRLDPLLEEFLLGAVAMAALGAVIAIAFWLLTGISPWPFVILAEVVGLGWGIVLLSLASPYHGR
jgi:hypothetical protein